MPRKMQPSYTKATTIQVGAIGDSITQNFTNMVRPDQFYPARLQAALREAGCPVRVENWGISGNTTAQMEARKGVLVQHGIPRLVVIYGGANDPANGITAAMTTANIETIATFALDAGAEMVLIPTMHYLNWESLGDTTTTENVTYGPIRDAQEAAVANLATAHPGQVAGLSLYGVMRQRVLDGLDPQGSASWHVAPADVHLNAYGEQIVADAMFATIEAQEGWLDALRGA